MLGALRNDEGVAFAQHDGRFAAFGIPHSDVELTVEDEEEFVGFFVDVPDMLTLGMGDPDVIIIDLADDSRTVDVVKGPRAPRLD